MSMFTWHRNSCVADSPKRNEDLQTKESSVAYETRGEQVTQETQVSKVSNVANVAKVSKVSNVAQETQETHATGSTTFDTSKAAAQAIADTPNRPNPALNHSTNAIFVGIVLTLLGGAFWGANATVSKILMSTYHVSPLQIACVRQIAAGILFSITAAACTPQKITGAVKSGRTWLSMAVTGIVCVLLTQVSYLCTIDWTNSGTATVLQSLNLLFVLVYVCLHTRRTPTKRETIGVILAFLGTALMATGGNFSSLSLPIMGLLWGLADAASTAALAIMPVKLIAKWGNLTVNGITFIISGLIMLPFVRPWATLPPLDWRALLLFTFTIVAGTFGAYWLFLEGIMRVGSVRGTLLGASEPVTAAVTAVLFTGAVFSWADFVGFGLIFVMMILLCKRAD